MRRRAVPVQQLRLLDAETATEASDVTDPLADYTGWLVSEIGLDENTARTHRRYADAMLRQSEKARLDDFLADPSAIVAALNRPKQSDTRQQRHTVVRELLDHARGRLPGPIIDEAFTAIESSFPGRVRDHVHLLDIDLGGDSKRPRPPRPYALAELDVLMTTARQRSASPIRDAALLALHLFSGLPPHLVHGLRWEDWRLTTLKDGIAWVELGHFRFVVGEDAVRAMQAHWLAEGQPSVGPVFRATVRPREKLKPRAIHNMMSAFAQRAGIPDFDLRRLRVAFAWSLKAKGWDDLALRDAFGYESLQSLRKALRPYESESALRRAQELLTLTPAILDGSEHPMRFSFQQSGEATARLALPEPVRDT